MEQFYINTNKQSGISGNNYEIHKETCNFCYPEKKNFNTLGYCINEYDALATAKSKYYFWEKDIDGCFYCCKNIHHE